MRKYVKKHISEVFPATFWVWPKFLWSSMVFIPFLGLSPGALLPSVNMIYVPFASWQPMLLLYPSNQPDRHWCITKINYKTTWLYLSDMCPVHRGLLSLHLQMSSSQLDNTYTSPIPNTSKLQEHMGLPSFRITWIVIVQSVLGCHMVIVETWRLRQLVFQLVMESRNVIAMYLLCHGVCECSSALLEGYLCLIGGPAPCSRCFIFGTTAQWIASILPYHTVLNKGVDCTFFQDFSNFLGVLTNFLEFKFQNPVFKENGSLNFLQWPYTHYLHVFWSVQIL